MSRKPNPLFLAVSRNYSYNGDEPLGVYSTRILASGAHRRHKIPSEQRVIIPVTVDVDIEEEEEVRATA